MSDAVVLAVIAAAVIATTERHDARVLASDVGITAYANGIAVVQVPYRRDGGPGAVTILVDGQTVVRNLPAFAEKYGNDNFAFRPSEDLSDRALVRVTFRSDTVTQTIRTTVRVGHASAAAPTASDDDAPTVAAQAAVAMAKAHAADGNLPADPATMAQEIRDDMHWTSAMTPEHYVGGLNLWALKKELPMRTEQISGTGDAILGACADAIASGGAAQLRIRFDRAGATVGFHTVSVVRIVRTGSSVFVSVRDGAGPSGSDVYEVRKGVIVGYGFSEAAAVIGLGFVQHWTK